MKKKSNCLNNFFLKLLTFKILNLKKIEFVRKCSRKKLEKTFNLKPLMTELWTVHGSIL